MARSGRLASVAEGVTLVERVVALAVRDAMREEWDAHDAALERIEARLEEQEQSFRHVLTMLIEWLEEDPSRRAA